MVDRDRIDILLKEYEICQKEGDGSARNFWTLFGFFISISTAVIGAVIVFGVNTYRINQIHPIWILLVLIFSVIVLTVLWFLKAWLERVSFFIRSNNHRMREIELELGMERGLKIWALDNWDILCKAENKKKYENIRKMIVQKFDFTSEEMKQKIADGIEPLPEYYIPPVTGKKLFFKRLFYPLIVIWTIVVILVIIALIYRLCI